MYFDIWIKSFSFIADSKVPLSPQLKSHFAATSAVLGLNHKQVSPCLRGKCSPGSTVLLWIQEVSLRPCSITIPALSCAQTPIGLALTDATSKAESSWAQSPSSGLCFSLTENKPPKAKMHSERSCLDWRNRSVKKMG